MYSQRNKNRERFRTQTFKEGYVPTSPKETKPYMTFHSPSAQQQLSNSRSNSEPNILIIQNLEKHIEYIQKKLNQTESQLQKVNNNNEWLKSQILEKEATIIKTTNRLQEEQMRNKELQVKYDNLQTDFSNYKLQIKVAQLNRELNQQKQYEKKNDVLNRSGRKDKFSSAFLPSPFGSPKHFQEKSPDAYHNITRESIPESNSSMIKNPFENSLWSQWRKLKNQKVRKEKQITNLTKKVEELKQQLIRQKKESSRIKTDLLRSEQKYSSETSKLKSRIVTYIKDQKMLMSKLKCSEQKMVQLSLTMKEKGEAEGERFFAHSSALELQQIFEKISHNLEFDSATIDITVKQYEKQEEGCQTEQTQDERQTIIDDFERKLKEKDVELSHQEKQWISRFEQSNNSHMNQLKEASDLIDAYKCRFQQLQKQLQEKEVLNSPKPEQSQDPVFETDNIRNYEPRSVSEESINCDIISSQDWMRQGEIVNRVQQLLDLNQTLKVRVQNLQILNSNLQKQNLEIEERYHHKQHILLSKVSEGQRQMEQSEQICINCSKSKQKLLSQELAIMESDHMIEDLHHEKDHFYNAYQDKMNQFASLQQETQQEIAKLKNELSEKSQALAHLLYENELKNEDYSRQKEEVRQLRMTVEKLEKQIQLYEEQCLRQ